MGALQSGVSGMLAHQVRMDAIGNNIANSNTIGFKSSHVLFADAMYQMLRAGTSPSENFSGMNSSQVGMGVYVAGTQRDFRQGSVVPTGRASDLTVDGNGMIAVTDGTNIFYTRDGGLSLDANGNLIHLASGMKVIAPANGSAVSAASTLRLPLGQSLARATSEAVLGGNLDSRSAQGTAYTISSQVYDSLGNAHDLKLTFTRGATPGTWDVSATSPDGMVTVGSPATMTFDEDGKPTTNNLGLSLALTTPGGAAANVDVSYKTTGMTQQAQTSSGALLSQNGLPPGTLTGFEVASNGVIQGVYTNGMRDPLGQLSVAMFSNPAGLDAIGSNLYTVGADSGSPVYGVPGMDGRGSIKSGQLEGSNVNLAQEFSDMIVTQRGYQANSRVITTADEMLQDVMGLKR